MHANGAVCNAVMQLDDGVADGEGGDSESSELIAQARQRLRAGAAEGGGEIPQII
jgi:hypothetical protein